MVNPLTANRIYVRIYVLIWLFIGLVHGSLLFFLGDVSLGAALTDAIVFDGVFAVLSLSIWYMVRYSNFETGALTNTIFTHLLGGLFFVGIWGLVCYPVIRILQVGNAEYLEFVGETIAWRAGAGVLLFLLVLLIYYFLLFYERAKEEQLRQIETGRLLKETELDMLKSQINPHFIFNSLNSLSALTLTDGEKANEMVLNLSSFLRYSISPNRHEVVPLRDEVDALQLYLQIEKSRFGEKLDTQITCKEGTEQMKLPSLILQPLIENAIKYGVYESTSKRRIDVDCTVDPLIDGLKVTMRNDLEPGGTPKKGKGIGLRNVRARMELIYDRNDLVEVISDETQFTIALRFPQNEN